MKEKIEKVKSWFKENWIYAASGAATAGVIALAIIQGNKKGDAMIDPFVIDKATTDWMDQLTTGATCKGKDLTVRELISVGRLDAYTLEQLEKRGIYTPELACEMGTNFAKEYPATTAVLDQIDGFWKFVNKPEEKGA